MCTSFIKKTRDNVYIGMNFDNNGMKYNVNKRREGWFIINVEVQNHRTPSFGVHRSGIFVNNLCVDSNGKGNYRRAKGVIHTSRLVKEITEEKIPVDYLGGFLLQNEVVNVPNWSTHNMICTSEGNVWIIEPGRGKRYRELDKGDFQVMTNVSLLEENLDCRKECRRYKVAEDLLKETEEFTVSKAFQILKETAQTEGEWITDLSMVFDKNAGCVYYVEKQRFDCITKYTLNVKERV